MKLAKEMGLQLGTFTNIAFNLHIYEKDWEKALEVIDEYREYLPAQFR